MFGRVFDAVKDRYYHSPTHVLFSRGGLVEKKLFERTGVAAVGRGLTGRREGTGLAGNSPLRGKCAARKCA